MTTDRLVTRTRYSAPASILCAAALCSLFSAPLPAAVIDDLERSLFDDVLQAFYPRSIDDAAGGYYVLFGNDWSLIDPAVTNKRSVSQARNVYTLSLAAQLYPTHPGFKQWARHGYEFLRDKLRDPVHGGYFHEVSRNGDPADRDKSSYGHSFILLALAHYYEVSGDPQAKQLAEQCFEFLEAHFHDGTHLGYHLWTNRQGDLIQRQPYAKDQYASLHIMEAFSALYRVAPDIPKLRERLEEMVGIFFDKIQAPSGFLQQSFTVDWNTYAGFPSGARPEKRYNHFLFGHDLEVGYLLWDALQSLAWDDRADLHAKIKKMVDFSLDNNGYASGGGVPLVGYYDDSTGQVTIYDDHRSWWVNSEAMNTFLFMAQQYPEDPRDYYGLFLEQWTYLQNRFLDPVHGGYVRSADAWDDNKGDHWMVSYHTGRTHMNSIAWLRKDRVAPSAPVRAKAVNITASSAVLSWEASTDNYEISAYRILQEGVPHPIAFTQDLRKEIVGLEPNTQYTFYVAARDFARNSSPLSNAIVFRTAASPR